MFDEHQIYRIDHFLGKETAQNVLAFRFANGIFEPLWNRNYIDYVEITAVENLGIEQRGGFYETAGFAGYGAESPDSARSSYGYGAACGIQCGYFPE